jgi:hypothetical protein
LSPAPGDDDVRPGSEDGPAAESESATSSEESDHDEVASKPLASAPDFGERMLALERKRDAQRNLETRLPDNEAVTFRSVTVAEIYSDQGVGSLTDALSGIDWTNFDEPLVDYITEARKGYAYVSGLFWLCSESSSGFLGGSGYGLTSLPSGIDRIYGQYYVLGVSIVALVLTFVLTDDEAK